MSLETLQGLRAWMLNTPRYYKRAVLVLIDLVLLSTALWVATSLRLGIWYVPQNQTTFLLMAAAPLICVATLWWFDTYKSVTRYMGYRGTIQVLTAMFLATLMWGMIVLVSGQGGISRTVVVLYGPIGALLLVLVRYAIKFVLESVHIPIPREKRAITPTPAVIYGAGQMGIRLLGDVRRARDREIVGFIDPSPTLWRQYVGKVKVYPPHRLARLVEQNGVTEVLVAVPGSPRRVRRDVLRELEKLPVSVKILPDYEDVASGDVGLNDLREVEVSDLLGRDPVKPVAALMERAIRGKSILVTGAGGSIGSELVRQAAKQLPRRIVLLEVSEPALYKIEIELCELLEKQPAAIRPDVIAVLGSVLDRKLVTDVIVENGIETIYHAAAYKHVPLVEANPFIGLDNNVFGTRFVAEAARDHGVERFVLVSTDKAVRPTNVMGASKRLAELILQAEATALNGSTIFSVVRFGNVLDSSGSVVPRFREQLRKGGPITVTHPEVTRYFMSIPEAAELVIQAGAMAAGGEVFVLKMGDPVRIDELARLMVRLSNLEVKDKDCPNGDIEINYVGLRPGEKLYEELLIGANTHQTEHPRIFKSDEPLLSGAALEDELERLRNALVARDREEIDAILTRTVEGYLPMTPGRREVRPERPSSVTPEWKDKRTPPTVH